LFALQRTERYRPLLALSAMGNKGYSYITLQDGTPILGLKKPQFANIFDLLSYARFDEGTSSDSLRLAMQQGKQSLVSYHLNGAHLFLHAIPLEANGWYMISILPTSFVEQQAQRLMGLSSILVLAILAVFCALLFYILHMRAYSNRQLFATAFVDQLTGADNFNRMCEVFSDRLSAMEGQAALLIFDINKFKVINDLHGYERGNQVLKRVACILRQNMQEGECFCRSVADKFILLLKYEDRRKFRARLNNLATQIRRDCTVEDSCLMIDVAFGIYEIKEQIPFYIMLDRAHLALEHAKALSVNKCRFYEESDRQRLVNEKQIENTMEQALQRGDFAIYFQPKCDFVTGKMLGAEALVRWKHPEEGIVRPDNFIPVFEKNGFILRLDMFILEQAVKLLAAWKEQGLPQVPIAVNFSRLHLNDSRYISQMRRLVSKHGVANELIEVELTESVIFNNLERAQSVIRELHREGFSVAMDDFGSGYSSLNVLKNLQFDSIKLDKEFLNGFSQNLHAQKVIEGTVAMIKALGVKVVAEGVETQQQADFLRKTGCDLAQGYFFARPLPAEDFEAVLKRMQP
jgi:diguanylate cyclase (GGDEF)-like protein